MTCSSISGKQVDGRRDAGNGNQAMTISTGGLCSKKLSRLLPRFRMKVSALQRMYLLVGILFFTGFLAFLNARSLQDPSFTDQHVQRDSLNADIPDLMEEIARGSRESANASGKVTNIIQAQEGSDVLLRCNLDHVASTKEDEAIAQQVSWMKRGIFDLLTVGLNTYSSDKRFEAVHPKDSQEWGLHIRGAKEEDSGIYECQLPTHPPTSLLFQLTVIRALAEIEGGVEVHVRVGSDLRLECVVRKSTVLPRYFIWYRESKVLNYEPRVKIQAKEDRIQDVPRSSLYIAGTTVGDSGNYTCEPFNARPASILVHVLNGEMPAAMQQEGGSISRRGNAAIAGIIWTLSFLFARFVER
ncbi:unnamed protein product [Darwinula stevensoni]|uniref:Ig-like domain-containing protein n=1 Tax=Darwinula stevensoni TaxID=69355 RepID=A0A7R9AFS4_9CRUS|nr:unnamed protein product [Darwinula stevensoni]CAG0902711.1 unnamed protein product [Darwinula stevensoni]